MGIEKLYRKDLPQSIHSALIKTYNEGQDKNVERLDNLPEMKMER